MNCLEILFLILIALSLVAVFMIGRYTGYMDAAEQFIKKWV